ncbi:MAG TPA: precorrin-6x reductase [Synechococcales bacterium UBA10510]|nr:precorrin-6x reductase [Synechococcales bacterium UBA10510]
MHDPAGRQPLRLWLIAGTGEGPRIASQLLERGWRLEVSVVSEAASLAYPAHQRQRLLVGALAGGEAIRQQLTAAALEGQPYAAVVDASHPFASQISHQLAEALQQPAQPLLLRLVRPLLSSPADRLLVNLKALAHHRLTGTRLLLAIGARQLAEAVTLSPGAQHYARLLPNPEALQRAMAAGIAPQRLAPLRPGGSGEAALLAALLSRWRIDAILCRQSGGITETLWRQLAASKGCELLLLQRPADPPALLGLAEAELLSQLEQLRQQLLAQGQPPGA